MPINFPDANRLAAIEEVSGKASGVTTTPADMATLTQLDAQHSNISVLTGLEGATNLTELWLNWNSISDISALAGLTNLTDLHFRHNYISDLSPLVSNTGLGTERHGSMWRENPRLNDASIDTHIPALQSRGVEGHV